MYLTNISIFVEKKAHPILSLIKTYITRNYFFLYINFSSTTYGNTVLIGIARFPLKKKK